MHLSSLSRDRTFIDELASSVIDLFVVIVVYQMHPLESATFQTLQKALHRAGDLCWNVTILIADNTPGGQRVDGLPSGVRYRAFPDNPGW